MIIWITFNTANYTDDRLTKKWIENRLDIFEKYTLQSLINQTNQKFDVYLSCESVTIPIINECLSRRTSLPVNIHFNTISNIHKEIIQDMGNYDYLYHIRLDSDNLYHKDFIQKLYDYKPKDDTQVIISQYGYVYDIRDGSLAPYYQYSPPFYAYIYKKQDFLNGFRYRTPLGHTKIPNYWKYEFVEGYNYMVTLHGNNVLNRRDKLNEKLLIEGEERKKILDEFGINISN